MDLCKISRLPGLLARLLAIILPWVEPLKIENFKAAGWRLLKIENFKAAGWRLPGLLARLLAVI